MYFFISSNSEHTKNLLLEAGAAQLRHPKQRKYGKSLRTSSRLVLLTGSPGLCCLCSNDIN